MGLRADPVGGGQFQQLVKQTIEAERQPIKNLEARKKTEEARLKTFQDFKGKFTNFQKVLDEMGNFRKFRELKVDLGDAEGYLAVTVDKERAEPGTYQIQVDQLAKRTSIMTNAFKSADEPNLGVGFVVAQDPNGNAIEIFIEEDMSSLRNVAAKINSAPNSPIRASVIKDVSDPDRPWRMIFTAKDTGETHQTIIPEFYFMDGYDDIYIDEENDAENALISVDGFPIEAEGNELKEFLTGVNMQLKQARPDHPFTVTIAEDYKKVAGKVKGMVDQVNSILEFINKQNAVDEKTDTKSMLTGDSSLQNIEYRLRNLLHEGFKVVDPKDERGFRFINLNQVGVEFTREGQLQFKEEKFTAALEKDFNGLSEAIAGEMGFSNQLKYVVSTYTRPNDGLLTIREKGMRERIKKIDDDIAQKERRVEQKTQALVDRFSRLQATLGQMQRQQQYMQSALGSGGGGGDLIGQLMGK
jgi:flagellar hook-associated protein 2